MSRAAQPVIEVVCDECGHVQQYPLESANGVAWTRWRSLLFGAWLEDKIDILIEKDGWQVGDDNEATCGACVRGREGERRLVLAWR